MSDNRQFRRVYYLSQEQQENIVRGQSPNEVHAACMHEYPHNIMWQGLSGECLWSDLIETARRLCDQGHSESTDRAAPETVAS